jgi:hypothetical protein
MERKSGEVAEGQSRPPSGSDVRLRAPVISYGMGCDLSHHGFRDDQLVAEPREQVGTSDFSQEDQR